MAWEATITLRCTECGWGQPIKVEYEYHQSDGTRAVLTVPDGWNYRSCPGCLATATGKAPPTEVTTWR